MSNNNNDSNSNSDISSNNVDSNNQPMLSESSSILNYANKLENYHDQQLQHTTDSCSIRSNTEDDDDDQSMTEIPLHEELDALSPLIMDNHTSVEHQENLYIGDLDDFKFAMKHSDTKDSMSSVDSDVSLSYDTQNLSPLKVRIGSANATADYHNASSSSDHETGKDSGCDEFISGRDVNQLHGGNDTIIEESLINEEEIEIPDDDMCEKICEQVEFYFSNENILKDAFLLKHVRRNKEGFVSLKLVSSFKRVRQLTKDWRVVGYAVKQKSKLIELNSIGSKIRRVDALPSHDETMPSRTIVATDLPFEKLTIEKASDYFSKCGEIELVRVLRPGHTIPSDVRQFFNKYPELQQKECALIEFVESQSARFAQNLSADIQVFEMVATKKKTGKKQSVTKMIENYKYSEHDAERSRGGGGGGSIGVGGGGHVHRNIIDQNNIRNILKKANPGYFNQPIHQCRKISFENHMEHNHSMRRNSNCSEASSRKYSNCSEGYSSCSDAMSRRTSSCSDNSSRRTSNCSDLSSRRSSNCSEYICHCGAIRRYSQCSTDSNNYRRLSYCNMDMAQHRKISNVSTGSSDINRRLSHDASNGAGNMISGNFERKISFECPRKISSSGFELIRKLSGGEQQYNYNRKISNDSGCGVAFDRKLSTDSGYDRKLSMESNCSGIIVNPVRRPSGSYMNPESVVRTPIGPDGSKGFGARTRKIGHTIAPV